MENEDKLTEKKFEKRVNAELIREIARLITEHKPATGEATEWEEELTRITELVNSRQEKLLEEEIKAAAAATEELITKEPRDPRTNEHRMHHGKAYINSYIKFLEARETKKHPAPTDVKLDMDYDYEILRSAISEAGSTLKNKEGRVAVLPYRALEVLRTQERLQTYLCAATDGALTPDDIIIKIVKPPASVTNPRQIYTWKEHVKYLGQPIWRISEAPPAIIVIKKPEKCPETLDKPAKMWYINSEGQNTEHTYEGGNAR